MPIQNVPRSEPLTLAGQWDSAYAANLEVRFEREHLEVIARELERRDAEDIDEVDELEAAPESVRSTAENTRDAIKIAAVEAAMKYAAQFHAASIASADAAQASAANVGKGSAAPIATAEGAELAMEEAGSECDYDSDRTEECDFYALAATTTASAVTMHRPPHPLSATPSSRANYKSWR